MSRRRFKPPKLNEQQEAVCTSHGRAVSVSAGAGSGKTAVLVENFVRLMDVEGAEVDEILTVTFTDKAAGEMKARINSYLEYRFEEAGDERLLRARRKMENAYISTLHSFAARVLRENSFEAGLSPNFTVLDAAAASSLIRECAVAYIDEALDTEDEAVSGLCAEISADSLAARLMEMHHLRHRFGLTAASLKRMGFSDPEYETADLLSAVSARAKDLQADLDAFNDSSEECIGMFTKSMKQVWLTYPAVHERVTGSISRLTEAFLAKNGVMTRDDLQWEEMQWLSWVAGFKGGGKKDMGLIFDEAGKLALQLRSLLLEPLAEARETALRSAADGFAEKYASRKEELGALDFDDLLVQGTKLLTADKTVANEYAERFRFCMVDEFQDTNELQMSLINAIIKPGSLFTVGDVKQSIYGFNGADMTIFRRRHEELPALGAGVALPLGINYRSRPEIIEFTNSFFKGVWGGPGDEDLTFEELQAGSEFYDADEPCTELIIAAGTEEEAVAKRIRQLMGRESGQRMTLTDKGIDGKPVKRDLNYGDIVILSRSMSGAMSMAEALGRSGIPYYIIGTGEYFSSPEITDMLNLFRSVEDPLRDLPLAAFLRSPLCGLSDEDLFWLNRGRKEEVLPEAEGEERMTRTLSAQGELYSALVDRARLDSLSSDGCLKARGARKTIDALRTMRSDGRLSDLVRSAIKMTAADAKGLASPSGKKAFGNLDRLVGIAISLEEGGLSDLANLIDFLEGRKAEGGREEEAPTESEDSDVVRLMSIHKAKGLESPVIFVTKMDRAIDFKGLSSMEFIVDNGRLAVKVPDAVTGVNLDSWSMSLLREEHKLRERRESKRILYVAMTRAREKLILTTGRSAGRFSKTDSTYLDLNDWLQYLQKAAPEICAADMRSGPMTVAIGEAKVRCSIMEEDATAVLGGTYRSLHGEAFKAGKKLSQVADDDELATRLMPLLLEKGRSKRFPVTLSVSGVIAYLRCPYAYKVENVFAVDTAKLPGRGKKSRKPYSAAQLGDAVHRLLGSVDFKGDLRSQLEEAGPGLDPMLADDAIEVASRFDGTDWHRLLQKADDVLSEVPFRLSFPTDDGSPPSMLSGRIDVVFRIGEERYVADYKSGRPEAGEEKSYSRQVGLYALALRETLGKIPREVALIVLRGRTWPEKVDAEMLERAEGDVRTVIKGIQDGSFYMTDDESGCEGCRLPNHGICPKQK